MLIFSSSSHESIFGGNIDDTFAGTDSDVCYLTTKASKMGSTQFIIIECGKMCICIRIFFGSV